MEQSKVIVSEHKVVEDEKHTTIYIAGLPYVIPRKIYKKINPDKEK